MRRTLYPELTQHLEMTLDQLLQVVDMDRIRLLVVISNSVKPNQAIWDNFVKGLISIGNLVTSEKLPRFDNDHDHVLAALGSLDDFRRYVANVQLQACKAAGFTVLTQAEVTADMLAHIEYWRNRATVAEERLDQIYEIAEANRPREW